MRRILVKTAWNHFSVPGDHAALPHPPAMVEQLVPDLIPAAFILYIARKFLILRHHLVTILVIVDLRSFNAHFIHPERTSELFYFAYLVLVLSEHHELPYNVRRPAPRHFFLQQDLF